MKHHLCSPELKLVTILFSLAIFLCGCSSSYLVSSTGKPDAEYSYGEMNEELKGQEVKIELKDGIEISAEYVKISDDSLSWSDQQTYKKSKTSILDINKIIMKSSSAGALDGLGLGLAGGVVTGLIISKSLENSDSPLLGVYVTILGAGIGIVVGQ